VIVKLDAVEINGRKVAKGLNYYVISPDGKRLAYVYQAPVERKPGQMPADLKSSAVIDGSREKEYDYIQKIMFSSDSKRYAYVAQKDKKNLVIVDGVENKSYDMPLIVDWDHPVIFSSDSQHYAYIVRTGQKSWAVVTDGKE
jgi:hypothetical protein